MTILGFFAGAVCTEFVGSLFGANRVEGPHSLLNLPISARALREVGGSCYHFDGFIVYPTAFIVRLSLFRCAVIN